MTGCYTGCKPPVLGMAEHLPNPSGPVHVVHQAVMTLPFTGADLVGLGVIGVVVVTVGALLARWS